MKKYNFRVRLPFCNFFVENFEILNNGAPYNIYSPVLEVVYETMRTH